MNFRLLRLKTLNWTDLNTFLTNLTHLIKGEIDLDEIKVKTNRFKDLNNFGRN